MSESPPVYKPKNRRKNGSCCIFPPNFDVSSSCRNDENKAEGNKDRHVTDTQSTVFVDNSYVRRSFEERMNTQTDFSKPTDYSAQTHSGPTVGKMATSGRLKRALSATEFKTRLTCPKGLLISTEPPKSGEFYRRRSNTGVFGSTRQRQDSLNNCESISSQHNIMFNTSDKEKEVILIELESVKSKRDELERENERLHDELENRNQVIDHLIDYMKSLVSQGAHPIEDELSNFPSSNCDKETSSKI